ncbi:MAG: tRNA (adenosine(37)-N6)-dimethylallyltransferase MiaA [Pseudomonadota bacterium]
MAKKRPPVALIAGPTASGKSALALALAQASGGVIVNADSAQLYRDLRILSASPDASDRRRADHRLYGVADGASAMSAAEWADRARHEIAGILASGRLPILVGGSGLYLRTLIDGIAPVPPINPAIREQVRGAPFEDNRARLETLDPEASSRLGPSDKTRIARALEVVLSTGQPLSHWQGQRQDGIGDTISLNSLILLPPRDWLYARCDARFVAMIDRGAIDEVAALLKRGLSPSLPVMRAIGVREIGALVSGEMTRSEAIAAGSRATRNYAKRQYTWFAHQPPAGWPRFTTALDDLSIAEALDLLGSTD